MAAITVPTKFVTPPNSHLVCSACKGLFREPVINVQCGHSFCKQCILRQSEGDREASCPLDGKSCGVDSLVVNRSVQSQIEDLIIFCRHGLRWSDADGDYVQDPDGCQEEISYSKRRDHEDCCDYTIIPCPNNDTLCGDVRRRDLTNHLQVCRHYPCIHGNKGCNFTGTSAEITRHTPICGFKNVPLSLVQAQGASSSGSGGEGVLRAQVEALTIRVCHLERERDDTRQQLTQCLSVIAELTEQQRALTERLDGLTTPGLLLRSPGGTGAETRLVRRSSSSGSLKSPKRGDNTWQMPFQFKCIGSLRGHTDSINDLKSHKSLLFSAGDDNIIKVWNLEALANGCMQTLSGHTDKVRCLCVGKSFLYSAGVDLSLRAWSLQDLTEVTVIQNAHDAEVAALVCTAKYVFSSSHKVIKVWNADTLSEVHAITGLKHWVRSLALNISKDKIYSGSHNTIEVWDTLGEFNMKGKISHEHGSVYSIAVTSQYIIAGTYNQNLHIFDVTTQKHLHKLSGHVATVTSITVTHSGRFMFTGSKDSKIQVWSLENFLPIQILSRHEEGVNVVRLHNDLLLTGSDDKEIKVFKYFKMNMGFTPS